MTRHTLARGAFAAAMGLTLSVGGLTPLAMAAPAADTPMTQETVLPAAFKATPRGGTPYLAEQSRFRGLDGAGAEGVFHTEEGLKGVQWTRYANGSSVAVTEPSTPWTSVQATGSDTLAYLRAGEVELRHADGTSQKVAVPDGLDSVKVFGSTVVGHKTAAQPDGTGTYTVETHLLTARADGSTRDVLVTDADGAAFPGVPFDYDGTYLVMTDEAPDGKSTRVALVDKETGKVAQLATPTPELYPMAVSSKYIALRDPAAVATTNKITLLSRADLSAPPVTVDLGEGTFHFDNAAVVGDQLLYTDVQNQVWAKPIGGGDAVLLVGRSTGGVSTGSDGTAVVIGGSGADDWGVRRITAGTDGKATVTLVKRFAPLPARIRGIALAQGELAVVDDSDESNRAYLRSGGVGSAEFDKRTAFLGPLPDCAVNDTDCDPRLQDLGDGRFAAHLRGVDVVEQYDVGRPGDRRLVSPARGSRLLEAAPNQLLFRDPDSALVAYDATESGSHALGQAPAAALWGSVLFRADRTVPGRISTRTVSGWYSTSYDNVAPCVPQELQASQRWLYWNCGPDGPAGAYDLQKRTSQRVPAGEALLGDGFVVTHDKAAGTLVLTGLDPAQPVSRVVGELPDSGVSQRHVRWSVDRFGGGVAYVDAQEQVHLVPSGVATQRLGYVDYRDQKTVDGAAPAAPLVSITFNKPVASWTLRARNRDTGTTYEVASGGPARGVIAPKWNGRDAAGNPMPNSVYRWTLAAKPADGVGPDGSVIGEAGLVNSVRTATEAYRSVTPSRLMDTRTGTGVPKAKVGPQGTVSLPVTGRGGVPATGVTAVVVNLTATNATAGTYVTAYPYGTTRPTASNLNVPAGKTVPNMVVVPVKDGKVTFYNNSGTVDLIADVQGYYAPDAGDLYQPLSPARLLDTRSGLGAPKAKLPGHRTLSLTVAGRGGVPTGAKSVVLNVTATDPATATTVAVVPQGGLTSWSGTSLLNPSAGETVSNLVVAPVVDGKVHLYNNAGAVDLIADVQGYYVDGPGSWFEPLTPARLLDSRSDPVLGTFKLGAGQTFDLPVASRGGVTSSDVTAVVLNLTATNVTAGTYLSAYPYGTARPGVSNLNVPAGKTVSNLVVVPVKDGRITLYNHAGSVDVIADVQGYFAK
ncbi:hypothetical protein [Streptomyces sp. NPDC004788]